MVLLSKREFFIFSALQPRVSNVILDPSMPLTKFRFAPILAFLGKKINAGRGTIVVFGVRDWYNGRGDKSIFAR
jgi:hypothetical protein